MYGFYGIDMSYIILTVVTLVLGLAAQGYITSTYKKWSRVPSPGGKSGAEMARNMLASAGATSVGIGRIEGTLTDNYDPRDNTLHLSEENFSGGSVASIAVACHEAGHAIQTAQGYAPIRFRTALVPVVSFSQQFWSLLFLGGILLNVMGLIYAAIALFAFSVLFSLVTLPVEIDASRRAVAYISQYGSGIDQQGAKSVLTAAALTYVAAALTSILQLLYLLAQVNGRRRD